MDARLPALADQLLLIERELRVLGMWSSEAPSAEALQHFGAELKNHQTTKNFLKLPYDAPLPEALIRRIAEYRVQAVAARRDDAFW